jgi:hypothetical protein
MAGVKVSLSNVFGEFQTDLSGNAKFNLPTVMSQSGYARFLSENDAGAILGAANANLASPETDAESALKVGLTTPLDMETFNYTAQNTGKHQLNTATMTSLFAAGGFATNASNINTVNTGVNLRTYAMFPLLGGCTTIYNQLFAFSAAVCPANSIVDFGAYQAPTAVPFAPTDGTYFRVDSTGFQGIINHNGSETSTGLLSFVPVVNKVYRLSITSHERMTRFWIDDALYGSIATVGAQGQAFMSGALPWQMRHVIVGGAAGAVYSVTLRDYDVILQGANIADSLGTIGNRIYGSGQGLSGGVMGSLEKNPNSPSGTSTVTYAVPTNTTAVLGTGLGGEFGEVDTLGTNIDGIIQSYQFPPGSATFAGRRWRIRGVTIDSFVTSALTGGGYNAQLSLCYGHTAVSLATAESATTKAPRRKSVGVQTVAAGATVLTQIPRVSATFTDLFVNPGEFVAIARKKVGTAPTTGNILHVINFDVSIE